MELTVTRIKIVQRGFTHRCPNCGARALFKPGALFELNPACPSCGCRFDADEGAFLGALALNYGVTAFGVVVPIIVVSWFLGLGFPAIAGMALFASVVVPIALYRPSRSWWLMCDSLFSPEDLPANQDRSPPVEPDRSLRSG